MFQLDESGYADIVKQVRGPGSSTTSSPERVELLSRERESR